MIDPALALFGFALLALVAGLALWPRRGLVSRLVRLLRMTEQVQVEDALKHLYDCETRGLTCTVESLAGTLEIGRGRAMRIFGRLQVLGLAQSTGPGFGLSASGRGYALRVLRTHRLVERYLADRTGMAPGEWHGEAERLEHRLTEAQTERLAHRIGHPAYDPHGDPIPTALGELPEPLGVPLTSVGPGTTVQVVHLEDEPPEAYERLVDLGLAVGNVLAIREITPERIRFVRGGREATLAAMLARNVTVIELPATAGEELAGPTLADLAIGERGTVAGISVACQGPQRRRLLDLGVVPGTVIHATMASAAGDPVAYDIRGALIGLRRQQAQWIHVRRHDPVQGEAHP